MSLTSPVFTPLPVFLLLPLPPFSSSLSLSPVSPLSNVAPIACHLFLPATCIPSITFCYLFSSPLSLSSVARLSNKAPITCHLFVVSVYFLLPVFLMSPLLSVRSSYLYLPVLCYLCLLSTVPPVQSMSPVSCQLYLISLTCSACLLLPVSLLPPMHIPT